MPLKKFLHELPDFEDLIVLLFRQKSIQPQLIEKDYWLMHCLWGLKNQNMRFDLKGGTSLSKGWGIINRFSEKQEGKDRLLRRSQAHGTESILPIIFTSH